MPERTLLHQNYFLERVPFTNSSPRCKKNDELPSPSNPLGDDKNKQKPKYLYGEYHFQDPYYIKEVGFDQWFKDYAEWFEAYQRRSGDNERKDI